MGLGTVDLILLIGSVIASAIIGIYFTNKNKSIESYMYGDKKMSVLPVGISLMTSCLSGLTILGASAEFYYQGPTYLFVFLPMLLSGPITAYTMLPVFHRMKELSLYKYLQKRYGKVVKYIVTVVFMIQMIFYNAVVLYLPSMATSGPLGISRVYSILILGFICVIYSGIGGLKAVIWSDLFQAFSMFSALIAVGVLGTLDVGGLDQVWKLAAENGRLELNGFFDIDLTTRHTLFGILIGSTLKHVYFVGVNQIQIQRALSLPTLRQGQLSFVACSIFGALMILMSSYLGAVLVSAYRSCDPFLAGEIPRRDAVLVHYIANRLSGIPGLRGIFVAGIFSATLSTLSSFTNSMAALVIEDFVKPIRISMARSPMTDTSNTRLAKILAVCLGVVCVLVAYLVEKANSRLLQLTTTIQGAIGVPFLTAFSLGIFTRFVNTAGILAGFLVTLSFGSYITIYQSFYKRPLDPTMPIYFNDQCERVFNSTMSASQLPNLHEALDMSDEFFLIPKGQMPFSIDRISYMTLPVVQLVLMVTVAPIVSILTGGWNQEVDDRYLASSMKNSASDNLSSVFEVDLGSSSFKKYNLDRKDSSKLSKSDKGIQNNGYLE